MTERNSQLKIEQPVPFLPEPSIYSAERFGSDLFGTGEGVKICVVDSGVPDHTSVVNIVDHINFTESDDERDVIGHSTLISGFISSESKDQVIGIAPKSHMYYAKMVDDLGKVRFDSFVAAVLWGIIKECDIILILMTTDINHPSLHDAIKKAAENGICVIATKNSEKDFPGAYKEVFSVGKAGEIDFPSGPFYSTYIEQQYAKATGEGVGTAIAGGLASLSIEKLKKAGEKWKPKDVYETLKKSIRQTA